MIKKSLLLGFVFIALCLKSYSQEYSIAQLSGKSELKFDKQEYKILPEVEMAFNKLKQAALKDGIAIKIVSGYRSFDRQKAIWNKKYKRYNSQGLSPKEAIKKIIEYSTIPGTSRHHWGTDIDVIDANPMIQKNVLDPSKFEDARPYSKLRNWLENNAHIYGFYIVYTNDKNRKGFKYEPWHYSYKSISKPMLQEFLKIDLIKLLENENILGKEYLDTTFLEDYLNRNVLDINKELK